ncbi:MAG: hypothetical protein ACU0GG_09710 [Paracoccaceae bacterium]
MTIFEKVSILVLLVMISYIMDTHYQRISQPFEQHGVDETLFARTDVTSGDEHSSKSTRYADPLRRRSWRSGTLDIREQFILYGYDEEGVRHAELILQRSDKCLSEREVVENIIAAKPAACLEVAEFPASFAAP